MTNDSLGETDLQDTVQSGKIPLRDVGMLCVLALAVRVYDLNRLPLWYDEVIHAEFCQRFRLGMFSGEIELVEPVFCTFLYFWQLVGGSDTWLRTQSVLFSAGVVPVAYYLGYTLFDLRSARMAGLFTAVAPLLVFYARDAKEYSLVALLEISVLAIALRYGEGKSRTDVLFLYTGLAAVLVYTHFVSPFFLAGLNAAYVVFYVRRSSLVRIAWWAIAQVGVVVMAIPLIQAEQRYSEAIAGKFFWPPEPTVRSFLVTAYSLVSGYAANNGVRALTLLLLAGLAITAFLRRPGQRRILGMIAGTAALSVMGLFAFSRVVPNSYYVDRFMIGNCALLLLVGAAGAASLTNSWFRLGVVGAVVALNGTAIRDVYLNRLSPNGLDHVGVYSTLDARGVAQLIRNDGAANDVVWHTWRQILAPIRRYSPEERHIMVDMTGRLKASATVRAAASAENINAPYTEVEDASAGYDRVWLVIPHDGVLLTTHQRTLKAWLDARSKSVDRYLVGGVGTIFPPMVVWRYDLASPGDEGAWFGRDRLSATIGFITAELETIEPDGDAAGDDSLVLTLRNDGLSDERLFVEAVASTVSLPTSTFARELRTSSGWRLQSFRDSESARIAMHTNISGFSGETDRLARLAAIPAGTYDVFVHRITRGKRYAAPTAELLFEVSGDVRRIAGHGPTDTGGWTWVGGGRVTIDAPSIEIALAAIDDQMRPEAFATVGRVIFRSVELANRMDGPPSAEEWVTVESGSEQEIPLTFPTTGRLDIMVCQIRDSVELWKVAP